MGTRFLLTRESRVPDEVKQVYLATPVTGTVVSTAVDGAPQRVIRTELVDHLERSGWLRRAAPGAGQRPRLPPPDRHLAPCPAQGGPGHEAGATSSPGPRW